MGTLCKTEYKYVATKQIKLDDTVSLSRAEKKVVDWERKIGLHHMYFEEFEIEIMRYGFSGLVTEMVLEKISTRIPLDLKKLKQGQEESIEAGFLHNGLIWK